MNVQALNPTEHPSALGAPALKFAYPSGSRPLAGYTIKRGIGRGGFGEVYYAVSDAGKEVALKLIRRNLEVELRGVTQCLNLKHSNLLALFDIKQDEQGDSWVIMEYVAGASLEEVINRSPHGLPPDEALRWMRGILAGVAYLHDHGIVHRDLKPANVFSDEGVVKIGDYGLSKFISCSRRSGQTESVGTVHYMAPEIANGRYGKEIDLYAVGIIFYELLTGRVPFEGESVGEVLMKHLTAEPDLSCLIEPYRTIVGRTLAKDPAQRVSSVQELASLLPVGGDAQRGVGGANVPRGAELVHAETPVMAAAAMPPPIPAVVAPQPNAFVNALHEVDRVFDNDEPILRAVRGNLRELDQWWRTNGWPKGVKIAVIVVGVVAAVNTSPLWLPLALVLFVLYGAYRIIRWFFVKPTQSRELVTPVQAVAVVPDPAAPQNNSPTPAPYRGPFRRWRGRPTPTLPPKSIRERVTELTGSLLLSALVGAVVSFVMLIARGEEPATNQYAWLTLTSVLGSWAILIPSKLWDRDRGEPILRRFTLMVFGLGVGLLAYLAYSELMVNLPLESNRDFPRLYSPRKMGAFVTADNTPTELAFVTYFAFLFLVVRWWRQADPLRSSRLSIWTIAVSAFCGAAVSALWPFPQPWGVMLAATTSICVQLSSPCVSYADRFAREEE